MTFRKVGFRWVINRKCFGLFANGHYSRVSRLMGLRDFCARSLHVTHSALLTKVNGIPGLWELYASVVMTQESSACGFCGC